MVWQEFLTASELPRRGTVHPTQGIALVNSKSPAARLMGATAGGAFVPEGRLIVAQQFTAGEVGNQESLRPGGTPERGDLWHGFNRPSGAKARFSRSLTQR